MTEPRLSPPLQTWYDKGGMTEINGEQIFTIDEGDPALPVVLLIHGFPTSSWDFHKTWPALRKNYRLVTIDMLGFGFSDKPDQRNYTIHKQADLFQSLLRELDIEEFHLLAHDYGVSVAQEMLARQFEGSLESRCHSCCFLNGGLFPETHQALLIQKLLLGPLGRYINSLTGFKLFSKSFSRVFGADSQPTQEELKLFWEAINFNQGRHVFHNLITYMNDRKAHRLRWLEPLQNSQIPLALINGSVDPVSGAHLVDRYQELNCRLDYLKQLRSIGHYPQSEDPNGVVDAYLEFLNGNF